MAAFNANPYHVAGPCDVRYGTNTTSTYSLGTLLQGPIIRITTSVQPVTNQSLGASHASMIFTGKSAIVEVVGIDFGTLWTVAPWAAGQLLGLGTAKIGALASALAKPLIIVERTSTNVWIAQLAVPVDPAEIGMRSTQEDRAPLSFLILPDADGLLFQTVPSYIWA